MENDAGPREFSLDNAGLLEAISHPLRVKILQALDERSLDLDELGKTAAIEDQGQLSFHLAKLGHLVRALPDGKFELTGDGREALWTIQSMNGSSTGGTSNAP